MKERKPTLPLHTREVLSKHTIPELISIAKDLGLRGYSGKKKGELIEILYQKITNKSFLEDLLLICDSKVWDCLRAAASGSSPAPVRPPILEPCKTLANLGVLQWIEGEAEAFIIMPPEIKDIFNQFAADGFLERKDRSDLLDHYALAATHLYGIISQDEFVSLFNAQNSHKTNIDEVFTVLIQHISTNAPYGFWNEYLTHSLFEDNEFKDADDLIHITDGKPRFIPEKSVLLQYADPNFYEKSLASDSFAHYFKEKKYCTEQKAAEITADFAFACSVDAPIGKALSLLDEYDLSLTKENVTELIPLLVNLANHTRKWSNCGFTPEEMRQRKLQNFPIRKGRKIGRNEPCPCGSGKKYKKCCGR